MSCRRKLDFYAKLCSSSSASADDSADSSGLIPVKMRRHRARLPALESVGGEWFLQDHGMDDSYRYFFSYVTCRLMLHQLGEGFKTIWLSSEDWKILCALLQLSQKDPLPLPDEHAGLDRELEPPPTAAQLREQRVLYSAVWETKFIFPGRFFLRMSIRTWKAGRKVFALETFEIESGLFTPVLALPEAAWREHMGVMSERIENLFAACTAWNNVQSIRMKLFSEDTPQDSGVNTPAPIHSDVSTPSSST